MQRAANVVLFVYYTFVITFPIFVFAQTNLPRSIVPCDGVNCTFCDLAKLAQNLINVGVFIFIFFAAGMFTYAGFLYLTSAANPSQSGNASKIFSNVTLGLIVLLSAWLIVDTLMKTVLGGDFGPWNNVCQYLTP